MVVHSTNPHRSRAVVTFVGLLNMIVEASPLARASFGDAAPSFVAYSARFSGVALH